MYQNILDYLQGAVVKPGKLAMQTKTLPSFKSEKKIQLRNSEWRLIAYLKRFTAAFNLKLHQANRPYIVSYFLLKCQ